MRLGNPGGVVLTVNGQRQNVNRPSGDVELQPPDQLAENDYPVAWVGSACVFTFRVRAQDRQPGHAGLRPQRGRFRGARGAADRGRLGADRGRRRQRRAGEHLRLHPGGQAGVDHRAALRRRVGRPGRRRRLPGRALRRRTGRGAARDPGAQLRRLRRDRRQARRRAGRPQAPGARGQGPPHPAAHHPGRTPARPASGPGGGSRRALDGSRRRRVPAAAVPRRRGPAEDRVRLRPPVLLLRDPVLPRRVRLPPAARDPGRGALAGRQRRARAGAGQRELHLLRQGPGQPSAARGGAARPGRDRGHRAGQDQLPAAR